MPSIAKGVIWSGIERLSSQGIQFILNIIIARILSPTDYGLIGMLSIFLQICQCLIDGGFSNALIQKTNRNKYDFGTVFIFNIIISSILYIVLFVSAPFISNFYGLNQLTILLRVLGINLIINALSAVQRTILTINIDFKRQSIITILASSMSGIAGIACALNGYGVWALVVQAIANSVITTIMFWLISGNSFPLCFKWQSFTKLGGYGIKLMSASLLNTIYVNIYSLFIGKKFSAADLGFYSRSDQFVSYASSNIASVISRVSFPVLCKYQYDKENLANEYDKFIGLSSYIIFPMMTIMAALSEPIIIVILTEKWLPAALILTILCFDGIWSPINNINLSLLQAVGRSDLFLKLEIIKKLLAITILFISIPFGLTSICIGRVIYGIIALNINMYYTVHIISKSYFQQISIWLRILLASIASGLLTYITTLFIVNVYIKLFFGLAVGLITYLLLSHILKLKEYNYIRNYLSHD